jgi:hypothetical protein
MEETTNINDIVFPAVQEGSRVLHNGKWYVYTNETWILETTN